MPWVIRLWQFRPQSGNLLILAADAQGVSNSDHKSLHINGFGNVIKGAPFHGRYDRFYG